MDLYYGITAYQILIFVLERLEKRNNATLLISNVSTMANSTDLVDNLLKEGLFTKVEIIDDRSLFIKTKNKKETLEKKYEVLINHIEKQLAILKIDLSQYKTINISADHFPLGIYCMKNRVSYNYYEDAAGVFSNEFLLFDAMEFSNPLLFELGKDSGCNGKSSFVGKRLIERNAQESDSFLIEEYDCEDVNIQKQISELSGFDGKKILKLFGIYESVEFSHNTCILFTKHFSNLNMMTLKEQEDLYRVIVDYFADDCNLVIKKHPSDSQGCYKTIFPNSLVLSRLFPSELLPLLSKKKFERGITISSTSIFNMSNNLKNTFVFYDKTEKLYEHIHKYFAVTSILKTLKKYINIVDCYGLNDEFFDNFMKRLNLNINYSVIENINESKLENNIIIVDKLNKESYTEDKEKILQRLDGFGLNDIAIFINSEKDYCFYQLGLEDIFEDLYNIEISFETRETESVFVYTKNIEVSKILKTFNKSKSLNYSKEMVLIKMKERNKMDLFEKMILEGYIISLANKIIRLLGETRNIELDMKNYELMYECLNSHLLLMLNESI